MTTKSKVPWPEQDFINITRDGNAPVHSVERVMLKKTPANSIRTDQHNNIDGSVTLLRTRNGFPEFTTTGSTTTLTEATERGFVAHTVGASVAMLFIPHNLTQKDTKYKIYGNTYSVQAFASTYNVKATDDTKWNDVVSFYNGGVRVNAKSMNTLGIVSSPLAYSFPWVIPCAGYGVEKYGTAATNESEKRVFAIGRAGVKSLCADASVQLLPAAPRTENRSMTVGPRVDDENVAWHAQLFHLGTQTWDGIGEWQFTWSQTTMMLTANYLTTASWQSPVAMPLAYLSLSGSTSGSTSSSVTLPPVPLWLIGIGEVSGAGTDPRYIRYPWRDTASMSVQGERYGTYNRTTYIGNGSWSEQIAGVGISYSATNTKLFETRTENVRVPAQYLYIADVVTSTSGEEHDATATELIWPSDPVPGVRGRTTCNITSDTISSGGLTRAYEYQTGSFSVTAGGVVLVSGSFTEDKSTGNDFGYVPDSGRFDMYMANPYGLIGASSGMGTSSNVDLVYKWYPATDKIPIFDTYKQNPDPPPQQTDDVLAEIARSYDKRAALYQSQILYDNLNSSGILTTDLYTSYVIPSVTYRSTALVWETHDYLLYDSRNGVSVSIDAEFSGADNVALLAVSICIKTPMHFSSALLKTFSLSYGDMLPTEEIPGTSRYAIPSPQIRALFTPLYQEQGSFKGAHYTTLAEEVNGATPAHLFNFVLYLHSYGDIGTCDEDNQTSSAVHFIPCNLLEMLYAYVFSSKYGVDKYQRYPVTNSSNYNAVMNGLFNTPWPVVCRDGVYVDWLNAFGGKYETESTTELTRT